MEIDFTKLLDEENIENVREAMNEYLPGLFAQDASVENMQKIMKIFDKAFAFNNREIMDLFIEYSDLKYEEKLYENCLAYQIGLQKGAEENK